MQTDTIQTSLDPQARNFALRGVAWSLGLFGLVRLPWFELHAILPLTLRQGRLAAGLFGVPSMPIDVTLACSGADALALCVGAILAYPARWPARLAGAAGGIALILAINTVRIGTLGQVAGSPAWFDTLHLYVWPALLMLAVAGYVFAWMRTADRTATARLVPMARQTADRPALLTTRFVWLAGLFLILFTAASPLYLENTGVLAISAFIARAAAALLGLVSVQATATANVLWTTRGGFEVTQECISTPLIPIYLAAVASAAITWRWRTLALLATGPLFVVLGIARLLVVALPAVLVDSPLVLVHEFYQLLLAGVIVSLAAFWRHRDRPTAWRRALLGVALGCVVIYLLAPASTALATAIAARHLADPQSALALLPAFQVGLYLALCVTAFTAVTWRLFTAGLVLLGLSQVAALAALFLVVQYAGLTPHVRDVRAWALAAPLLLIVAMVRYDRPRR